MNTQNNYRAVYKNTGLTPRTLQEAYRDGEYGYSIHLFKDDASQAFKFLGEALMGFLYVAGVSALVYAVLTWAR